MPRPVHFEIHGSEPEKLVAFYTSVFGWTFTPVMPGYWLIDTGKGEVEGINGGLMKRLGPAAPEGAPVNAFVVTIHVPSVDAYVERALKAGGTMALPKMPIPNVGWQAYVKDPDGNILGLHQGDANAK